jgi:hypothetical protein
MESDLKSSRRPWTSNRNTKKKLDTFSFFLPITMAIHSTGKNLTWTFCLSILYIKVAFITLDPLLQGRTIGSSNQIKDTHTEMKKTGYEYCVYLLWCWIIRKRRNLLSSIIIKFFFFILTDSLFLPWRVQKCRCRRQKKKKVKTFSLSNPEMSLGPDRLLNRKRNNIPTEKFSLDNLMDTADMFTLQKNMTSGFSRAGCGTISRIVTVTANFH